MPQKELIGLGQFPALSIAIPPDMSEGANGLPDFSSCTPEEYFMHETGLYQRIDFHARIRLGYGKAIAVLKDELDNLPTYEQIIWPHPIDQLENVSPLTPNRAMADLSNIIRHLVDAIGLHRALHLLKTVKSSEVPGIRYDLQSGPVPQPPHDYKEPAEHQAIPTDSGPDYTTSIVTRISDGGDVDDTRTRQKPNRAVSQGFEIEMGVGSWGPPPPPFVKYAHKFPDLHSKIFPSPQPRDTFSPPVSSATDGVGGAGTIQQECSSLGMKRHVEGIGDFLRMEDSEVYPRAPQEQAKEP